MFNFQWCNMIGKMFKKYLKKNQSSVDIFNLWVRLFESNDFKTLESKICKSKISPNEPTINGLTPLHIACIQGNTDAVEFLLNYDIEVNVKSDMGTTPIDEALFYNYIDCMDILLEYESKKFSHLAEYQNSPKSYV